MVNTTEHHPSSSTGFADYMAALRRRKTYVGIIAPIFILGAIFLAFWLTPQFQSTAAILLEPSSVDPKVVATTVISYSSEQIEIVQGRVMTVDTLKDLVKSYDPYPGTDMSPFEKAHQVLEDTSVERIDPVTLKPLQESNAFALHYRNVDRERAAVVTGKLAQLFLTYNQKSRQQAAQEAATFLSEQAKDVSRQLQSVDEEIKVFKSQHGDALPELMQRNQEVIERDQHELENLEQEILRSEEKESLLAVQLSQTSPNMITQSGDLTDLPTVRAKLAEAQQRYTPDHPEVKRLKQAIEQLSVQQSAVAAGGVVTNANNPLYMTTASQLKSARNELSGLRAQANRLRGEIDQYEAMLRRTPGVEREYSDIVRRRNSLQNTYQQIQDKLQNANIAQEFETQQGGERFTLIRAPSPAKLPSYPNRIGLILLGLVLGFLGSAVAVVIAESGDPTIRGSGDLPMLAGTTLLANIPIIPNTHDRRMGRLRVLTLASVYGAAVLAVAATVIGSLK